MESPLRHPHQLDVEVANDAARIEHDHFHKFTGVVSHDIDAITRTAMVESASPRLSGMRDHQDIIDSMSKRLRFKGALGRLFPCLYDHWILEEEPERTGRIAHIVNHPWFDVLVRIVIFADCITMAFAAGALIDDMGQARPLYRWAEMFFLIAYSLDLAARLYVHRLFFFWNSQASMNWFDFILVVLGWAVNFLSDLEGGLFRVIRLVKVGKVLRAFKAIDEIERMHMFLVCFVGSMGTLFWCIVTMFVFLYMFSLVFLEIVGSYLKERVKSGPLLKESIGADIAAAAYGESYQQYYDTEELLDQYGSVSKCMFTLVKSISGGDDWSQAYNVIAQTGEFGAALFIFFIAFFLIAVMNLITGFFVESAMECLRPDTEKMAVEQIKREFVHASELERLCLAVDDDQSGALSRTQFKEGIEKGKIPRLLMLLGLNKEHVLRFFDTLALNGGARGQGLEEHDVNIHSFVQGCMRLKGAATNFDLQLLSVEIKKMNQASQRTQRDIRGRLVHLEQLVTDAIRSDGLDSRGVKARGPEPETNIGMLY